MGNIEMTVNVTRSVTRSTTVTTLGYTNTTNSVDTNMSYTTDGDQWYNEYENEVVVETEVIYATPKFIESKEEKFAMLVYLIANATVALAGNTALALAICTTRSLRKISNAFYLNLAIADLLTVAVMVLAAVSLFGERQWHIGARLCDAWFALEFCAVGVVIFCIETLTANMHLQISAPFRYDRWVRRKKLVLTAVLTVWLVAGGVSLLPISLRWHLASDNRHTFSAGSTLTTCRFRFHVGFAAATSAMFLLHCGVIFTLNVRLYVLARRQQSQIRRFESVSNYVAMQLVKGSSLPRSLQKQISFFGPEIDSRKIDELAQRQSATLSLTLAQNRCSSYGNVNQGAVRPTSPLVNHSFAPKLAKTKRLKAIKTLTIMLLNFFICWFPFFVVTLTNSVCDGCVRDNVSTWVTMLAFINASTNPIIYTACNKQLRDAMLKLVRRRLSSSYSYESRSTHSFDFDVMVHKPLVDSRPSKSPRAAKTHWPSIEFSMRKTDCKRESGVKLRRISSCGQLT